MDEGADKVNGTGSDKFSCPRPNCSRMFARKEHLSRHALSHSDTRYFCSVCSRAFIRSDSLQRHLATHGDAFRPKPSNRSKHACVACRLSKAKCSGDERCSTCKKKGLVCKYEQHMDGVGDQLKTLASQIQQHVERGSLISNRASEITFAIGDQITTTNLNSSTHLHASASNIREPTSVSQEVFLETLNKEKEISSQWIPHATVGTETESQSQLLPSVNTDASSLVPESFSQRCHEIYFTHFHYRWTIIHASTYDPDECHLLSSSIVMIGAWLDGVQASKDYARTSHLRLVNEAIQRLTVVSINDTFRESLPASVCQAAVLNIVFGLYCGNDVLISKAIILRNILVGVLREVGFFTAGIPFDKPGDLLAFRHKNIGDRSRLACYLLKIDAYLNLLRCQPSILCAEDVTHYLLPSTYSLYNANGLGVWETRLSIEPAHRCNIFIHRMIGSPKLDADSQIEDGMLLIEDIQIGLCAMYHDILSLSEKLRHSIDINNAFQRDLLQQQLEFWKIHLVATKFDPPTPAELTREQQRSMRFYYGFEDHTKHGWESVIYARPHSLYFDAAMLYHLLYLHLYTDIRMIKQTAQDLLPGILAAAYGEPYRAAQRKREDNIREFTQTQNMRRALCHSASILVSFDKLSAAERAVVDPMYFIALSTAALVVWASCNFANFPCRLCSDLGNTCVTPTVELTQWSDLRNESIEREMWIEKGGGLIILDGFPVCICAKELLALRFQERQPADWDAANSVAPGVFEKL
ncbi:hypothetical protein BJ878DRAFT_421194 [Calycina marina]|uniref:Uncharacterized protein n=1 Tax=Calycina marina TaxID=1763456 RepID=A0A9P8CGJ4_9HELO|nr:hypothetical protein BJ878DRAFT_421194 [Calycina marina]